MGAVQIGIDETKGKYGMVVYLNKINFYPGETIFGEIKLYLKNNSPYIPQQLNNPKILLNLIHREYWQNHENLPSNIIPNNTNKTNGTNIISDYSVPLSDEGQVQDDNKHFIEEILSSKKETYNILPNNNIPEVTIPFQILIPEKTNHSLEFLHTAKIYAYSRTYLKIEIPDSGNQAKFLIFIQKFPSPLKSELTIIKSVTKKKLGFFGQGNNINFQGSYPKNSYGFNEVCPINIKLDTFSSKEAIKSISVILKRKVSFLQNGIKSLFKFNEYTMDLWQNTMSSFESAQDFNFNIPLNESSKIYMQRKSIFVDINSVNKQNLICLLPSYEGQFIKCEYYIQIKVNFDSMLIKDPEFIMPLDIGHTPSIFVQNCMLDINKIFNNYNRTLSMFLMMPNFNMNNMNNMNNINNINNNKNDENLKKVFGMKPQDNKNLQNFNKVFGFENNNNINYNKNNNINNNNIDNDVNKINENTPEGQDNYQQNNNNQINIPNNNYNNNQYNIYDNINLENSNSLPSLEEINSAKNEQAAPGLTPNA